MVKSKSAKVPAAEVVGKEEGAATPAPLIRVEPMPTQVQHYMAHWLAPLPDGTPRTIEQQFRELEREGIAGLYCAFAKATAKEFNEHGSELRLGEFNPLRFAWAESNGAFGPGNGGDQYGVLWEAVRHELAPIVEVGHIVTAEEAGSGFPFPYTEGDAGKTFWHPDYERIDAITSEKLGRTWVEVYTAEVRNLLGDTPDETRHRAFVELRERLKDHGIGTKEGRDEIDWLKGSSTGAEAMRTFGRICEYINSLLDKIAGEHPSQPEPLATNGTTATQGTTDRPIIWKGNPAELFALFEELVGKGWIELPKNRGKRSRAELARTVHAAFAFASGTILTEGTALNYLKKGRDGINEQRPEPRVVFTLKRNPDVGTDYDPDKAGE